MALKRHLIIGSLLAALGVILGAFGAHAIKEMVEAERLEIWKTANYYHMVHSLGILISGMIYDKIGIDKRPWSLWLFLAGILCFSGSLYLLCLYPDMRWLGPITPIGGVFFIAGW